MSVEGVWKVEILGAYGWEAAATAFLRKGRYLAASANHYSLGSYEEDGKTLKAEVRITQFGQIRTVFGSKKKHVDTLIEGKIDKADRIVGTARSSRGEGFDVRMRLSRLGRLD